MSETLQASKRNLVADKALCDKASPGPWTYCQRGCDELGYDLDEPPNGPPNGIRGYFQRGEDAEMVAESRVGWPHAIGRAIAAEAEVERLRKQVAALQASLDEVQELCDSFPEEVLGGDHHG